MTQRNGRLAAELDTRGHGLGIVDRPYGIHAADKQPAMLDRADSHRLRYSGVGRCLHRIARGRCDIALCREDHSAHSDTPRVAHS